MSNLFIKCMGNEQFYKLKLIQEINKELNTCISDKILFAALKEGTECYWENTQFHWKYIQNNLGIAYVILDLWPIFNF